MARQAALFLDRGERLWEILQKAKTALDAEEYTILAEACRAEAPVRPSEKCDLVAAWMTAYAKGCGTRAPRLTEKEAGVLGQLAKRVGGAEALLVLIRVYFPWRKTWPKNLETPQPTPFGLQKHIAKVQEFAAQNANRSTLPYGARDVEAARRQAEANPVDPKQMRNFVQQLKGGLAEEKSLDSGPRDREQRRQEEEAQLAVRRRELADQAEELRRRELAPTERLRRPQ